MSGWFIHISIGSVILPIACGLFTVRKSPLSAILLLMFVMGLITEYVMLIPTLPRPINHFVFDLYGLLEFSVFLGILGARKFGLTRSAFLRSTFYFAVPLWLVCLFLYPQWGMRLSGTALFNTIYQVVVAFYAVYEIIKLVEAKDSVTAVPLFWIFLGFFVYNFGTFFLMSFLNTAITREVWYVSYFVNISAYLLYALGLWKERIRWVQPLSG